MKQRIINFLYTYSLHIFWFYIISLFLIAVLPFNSQSNIALNNLYVIDIRLDHLLHSIVFIPALWVIYRVRKLPLGTSLLLALLLAITAEGIQFFLTYRAFNVNDMISNVIGVMLGLGVMGRRRDEETERLRD